MFVALRLVGIHAGGVGFKMDRRRSEVVTLGFYGTFKLPEMARYRRDNQVFYLKLNFRMRGINVLLIFG